MGKEDKCFICGTKLTEEKVTEEHIFLKSLGDTLTSKRIICKDCNSKLGDKLDGDFSNEHKDFIILFNKPSRDKKTKLLTKCENNNQEYLLDPRNDWKLSLKRPTVNAYKDNYNINVKGSFKDKKQGKNIINKIAKRKNIPLNKIDYSNLKTQVISNPKMKTILHLPNYNSNILEFVKMSTEFALIHYGNDNHRFDFELNILKMIVDLPKRANPLDDINDLYCKRIMYITYKHDKEKLIPKNVTEANHNHKIRSALYTFNNKLYCAISIMGIKIVVVPLALHIEFSPGNQLLAYYNGYGN